MAKLSIDRQLQEATRELDGFADKARNAAVRAINKTIGNVRTEAVKLVRLNRALSASTVRNAFVVTRATRNSLTAAIVGSNKPIPLRDYGARQTRKGVSVKVGGTRKLVTFAGNRSFIVDKISGHVFARKGKRRLPIKKLYGPSIASAANAAVIQALERMGKETFRRRYAEEVRFERIRMERAR